MLGSERHESRRIDNQLRGRAGRQGDPGESRFYLSLEDELMRLFATGAMNWVMGRALPDDVPIEAKMVTKAIERAQNTVEARNAEIRKDVLKYDEVMNEQRKVIYARRRQILEERGPSGPHPRGPLQRPGDASSTITAWRDFIEDWDLEGLVREARLYYPTEFTADDLADADLLRRDLRGDGGRSRQLLHRARSRHAGRRADTMRALEREVMIQIIDTKWREHLSEMDYLREGINLRAMGQQDPLVEWQRDGYDMFGQMMSSVDDDYVKIVMHAQVQVLEQGRPTSRSSCPGRSTPRPTTRSRAAAASSGPGPPDRRPGEEVVFAPEAAANGSAGIGARSSDDGQDMASQAPIVKASAFDRAGRNDPCPCGSGKKFKFCHGKPA